MRKLVFWAGSYRAEDLVRRIEEYLGKDDRVVDVGSGTCNISKVIRDRGTDVVPVDVANLSFVDGVEPVLYDGKTLPMRAGEFDIAMLITVLHHTRDPEAIIKEAKRVARKLIIVEDIYKGLLHKYWVFFWDSLINLEFFGHPHTNKSDVEWRALFGRLGLEIKDAKYQRSFVVFSHATYYLVPRS